MRSAVWLLHVCDAFQSVCCENVLLLPACCFAHCMQTGLLGVYLYECMHVCTCVYVSTLQYSKIKGYSPAVVTGAHLLTYRQSHAAIRYEHCVYWDGGGGRVCEAVFAAVV